MINVTKTELLGILDDMRVRILSGDSFEGFIQYGFPDEDIAMDPERVPEFGMVTRYRIGNLQGQGGMRIIE